MTDSGFVVQDIFTLFIFVSIYLVSTAVITFILWDKKALEKKCKKDCNDK